MGKINNLKGQRFGRLLVLGDSGRRSHRHVLWTCYCDCGKFTVVSSSSLRPERTSSCGCLRNDHVREALFKHGDSTRNRTTRLYHARKNMKSRCSNKNDKEFKYYGGRGIKVCPEWKNSYPTFKSWALSHGYEDGLTIDRIDNDGDYCPENCQWLTRAENSRKGSNKN